MVKGWMQVGAVGAFVLGLGPAAHAGFSDDELQAIYTQMKPSIRCGMTEAHLVEKYRGCAESSTICDASLITMTDHGPCRDALVFQNLGGPDPSIVLNGQVFPKPVRVGGPGSKKTPTAN